MKTPLMISTTSVGLPFPRFENLWCRLGVAAAFSLGLWSSMQAQSAGALNGALSLNPDPVVPGQILFARIVIANSGSSPVTGVTVRLTVPNGLSFYASNSYPAPTGSSSYFGAGDLCTWSLGTINPGGTRSIGVPFSVSSSLSSGTNLALRPTITAIGISDVQLSETAVTSTSLPVMVALDADKDPLLRGDTVTYTATFANADRANAPNVSLMLPLPAGTTFVAASHDGAFSEGNVRWSLGTLSPGESGERRLTVAVNSAVTVGAVLVGRATLTDAAAPSNSSRAIAICPVVSATPLSVKATASPSPISVGGIIRMGITIGNPSNTDHSNVVARLMVPPSTSFYAATTFPSPSGSSSYFAGGDITTWSLGAVRAGEMRTILVPLSLNGSLADGVLRSVHVQVGTSGDADASASQAVVVDSTPVLSLAMEEDRDPVAAGENLSYTVTLGNPTNVASPNVALRATLPASSTFVSANGGGTFSGGVVTWNLGTIGAGKGAERSVVVKLNEGLANGTVLTARATAEDTLDPQNTSRAIAHTTIRAATPLTMNVSLADGIYTFTTRNRGSSDLGGVETYALTPDKLSFYASNAGPSPAGSNSYYAGGNMAKWTLGSLFAGQSRLVTVPQIFSSSRPTNGTLITYQAITVQPSGYFIALHESTARIGDSPQITSQPRSTTVNSGGSATFSATIAGSNPAFYQWRLNGQDIAGATGATLTINNVQSADAGSYTVFVSDTSGSVSSNAGTLIVTFVAGLPSITTSPLSQSAVAGGSVSFSVAANGTPPLSYEWRKDGAAIPGATGATLTLSPVVATSAGSYSVVVTNGVGSVVSGAAAVAVTAPAVVPAITTQPADQIVNTGAPATFGVGVSGTAPFSYQWRKDGAAIAGANSATLVLPNVGTSNAGSYTVLITNAAGSVTSAPAILGVGQSPTITTQPESQSVAPGSNVFFSVVVSGTPPLTYQWSKDGRSIAGANNPTLALTAVANADAGNYAVVVSNSGGPVSSRVATLIVSAASSRLANLSVRTTAGAGDQTLIVGFVVAGAGGTKPVLVRGVGPSLTAFGVAGALADPQLALFRSGIPVATNDNWGDSASFDLIGQTARAVGAFTLDPRSRDAAIYAGLQAGNYSAQLVAPATNGIGLVELYDVEATGALRLINVSARSLVGTGANILIAGFSIQGNTAKTVLLRAVGPTLTAFGVGNALADPQLALLRGADVLDSNDDWWPSGGAQTLPAVFASVGAFSLATQSRDAVLLVRLLPGQYTAQVTGAGSTTGVALVEVYEVP